MLLGANVLKNSGLMGMNLLVEPRGGVAICENNPANPGYAIALGGNPVIHSCLRLFSLTGLFQITGLNRGPITT
jgi:hypothetical protein